MSSKKLDPNDPSKEYTGVWIPKEVMECKELCATDKITYAEIASFTECYASNEWLAERIGRSVSTASKSVNRLIELGFVEPCGFNGRFRKVRVANGYKPSKKRRGSLVKNGESASQKMANRDNSKDNSKDIMDTKVSIGEVSPETYGKAEINQLFETWEQTTGLPITSNRTKNRYACNNLIGKYGVDGVEKLIRVVEKAQTDRYAPRVADFCDLQAKLNQLLVWAKGKAHSSAVISVEDF